MPRVNTLPAGTPFTWVDLVDPSDNELKESAPNYGLPLEVVRDFLNKPHLPKFERMAGGLMVVLRAYDEKARGNDTYQALTRRLVVFLTPEWFFTVRRRDQAFAAKVIERFSQPDAHVPKPETLLSRLATGAVRTYEEPLKEAEERLDRLETLILDKGHARDHLKQIYALKRRCALFKRMLGRTLLVVKELRTQFPDEGGWWSDLQEETDRLHAWADELQESAAHLLNMQLALQSHRTNEVMRVLTVFSAFFLPLTFLVGVYGMNFKRMPELEWRFGYLYTWGLMVGTVAGILWWFRRKGWLK
jgi:magnesium transporter